MSTWYMGILGFIVPVGIAHLMAVGTHKIFKLIKPSFEFRLESITSGLIEKIYAYGLYTLIILDFIIFYNTVIY